MEFRELSIREMELLLFSLKKEISRQKKHDSGDELAFKAWLEDSQRLASRMTKATIRRKSLKKMIEEWFD